MYRIFKADKDTYITNQVINGSRAENANVGAAGSLNLFKLYGHTTMDATGSLVTADSSGSRPNIELTRLLIHYDIDDLRDLVAAGKIDPGNSSFNATVKLFDVYGGQPTPSNFTVALYPLSRSFDEGLGRDVVYCSDRDTSNFLTGSRAQGPWLMSGCLSGGLPGTVDYITASSLILNGTSLKSVQTFTTGEEDLEIDVTTIVSATLAGLLPDNGFRISFDSSIENDHYTYFVKRFASRTAFNESKHPRLIVKFDDSIQDDVLSLELDSPSYLFLYNYVRQAPANLTSGSASTPITGSNCLILKLMTEISGGWHTLSFTGSQHTRGIFAVTGVYSASVTLPSTDTTLMTKLAQSGTIKLTPVWGSLDGTLSYLTGSAIYAYAPSRGAQVIDDKKFTVTVHGLKPDYFSDEEPVFRTNVFDVTSQTIRFSRLPVEHPGVVVRDVHYQVRDSVSGIIEIPFDTTYNSTRLSSDANGMYFKLDMTNLTKERSYVIDILVVTASGRTTYKAASPVFRVTDVR